MSSITHVVDSENKEILNQYEYDAWGNPTLCEEKIPNRFLFNGQQYDQTTQQYYLRARYYNLVIARFTQEDTYRGDGLNLYAYCANNPVYYVDPSGNICETAANKIREKIANGDPVSNNERRKLAAYDRWKARKASNLAPASQKVTKSDEERGEGSRKTDFYVKPNGDVVPATGYRYMDSKYAQQTMETMSAPGSYFGFEKFDSASAAQDAFQIAPEWSDCKLRGEFDTLQVIDGMYVPKTYGEKGEDLEPFTCCYPEYGKGGAQQFIYKGIIKFEDVKIIGD